MSNLFSGYPKYVRPKCRRMKPYCWKAFSFGLGNSCSCPSCIPMFDMTPRMDCPLSSPNCQTTPSMTPIQKLDLNLDHNDTQPISPLSPPIFTQPMTPLHKPMQLPIMSPMHDVSPIEGNFKVFIFTKPNDACPACRQLKKTLTDDGFQYEEIPMDSSGFDRYLEMFEKKFSYGTVPHLYFNVGDTYYHLGGRDDYLDNRDVLLECMRRGEDIGNCLDKVSTP